MTFSSGPREKSIVFLFVNVACICFLILFLFLALTPWLFQLCITMSKIHPRSLAWESRWPPLRSPNWVRAETVRVVSLERYVEEVDVTYMVQRLWGGGDFGSTIA